jgi:hyperosmotically inducible periplasmic protein
MAAEPELARAISVSANADKKEVTLSGTVPSEPLRTEAVRLAKSSGEGLIVTDKIDVKPRELARSDYTAEMARDAREKAKASGETVGESIDDAWIHTKITAKLIGDSQTPARKINVDVVKKVLTLRGTVESAAAKEEAERIAKETEGVLRVRNLLKVAVG